MKRILSLAVLVAATLILWACGGGAETVTALEPVPPEFAGLSNPFGTNASSEGANIFKTNCESCHGSQGHGDGPASAALDPAPKNLADLQTIAGDDYLFWRIATGKPGTSMAGWKGVLTDDQIWKVVSFIRTLK